MESALYGIYALVVFVSEISLVRCAHSFDFWYVTNSCVNTVRPHFPWSILYVFLISEVKEGPILEKCVLSIVLISMGSVLTVSLLSSWVILRI